MDNSIEIQAIIDSLKLTFPIEIINIIIGYYDDEEIYMQKLCSRWNDMCHFHNENVIEFRNKLQIVKNYADYIGLTSEEFNRWFNLGLLLGLENYSQGLHCVYTTLKGGKKYLTYVTDSFNILTKPYIDENSSGYIQNFSPVCNFVENHVQNFQILQDILFVNATQDDFIQNLPQLEYTPLFYPEHNIRHAYRNQRLSVSRMSMNNKIQMQRLYQQNSRKQKWNNRR